MLNQLIPGLRIALALTALTGLIYPGVVTALCQWWFPFQANGSLITRNGRVVGSSLIGQSFTRPEYFHPRPSAAGAEGYDASASSGSNLGPTSQKLVDRIQASMAKFRQDNPEYAGPLPVDLLTASASGVDPHISPASAEAQIRRVARSRGMDPEELRSLVKDFTEPRTLGLLGETRVNVLRLNLALDQHVSRKASP